MPTSQPSFLRLLTPSWMKYLWLCPHMRSYCVDPLHFNYFPLCLSLDRSYLDRWPIRLWACDSKQGIRQRLSRIPVRMVTSLDRIDHHFLRVSQLHCIGCAAFMGAFTVTSIVSVPWRHHALTNCLCSHLNTLALIAIASVAETSSIYAIEIITARNNGRVQSLFFFFRSAFM